MAKSLEKIDSNHKLDDRDLNNENDDENNAEIGVLYPKLETNHDTTAIKPITSQPSAAPQQTCVLQQTTVSVHRNGHSRNPSSINGITIATQVIQPPPNKPDAINSLLKLIRFRSEYEECDEKSQNRQICGIREARIFSK